MTEEASSDDYSRSRGYGPHRRRQPGHLFPCQIVSRLGGDIRLAQCTTLLVRRDAILTMIGRGVATYAAAAPTRRLPVGKFARFPDPPKTENPFRPRHYECRPLAPEADSGCGRGSQVIDYHQTPTVVNIGAAAVATPSQPTRAHERTGQSHEFHTDWIGYFGIGTEISLRAGKRVASLLPPRQCSLPSLPPPAVYKRPSDEQGSD